MNITYDITTPHALNLGHQYDHNLTTVTFTGFVPENTEHTIYLKLEGIGLYPLLDMSFTVSQAFTLKYGTIKGQLMEFASDETLIKNSKIFDIMLRPSIDEHTEIVERTPNLDLWFSSMSELYQVVDTKLNNGELNGKSAYEIAVMYGYVGTEEEWIAWVQNKITYEKIIAELGYTPANIEDVPIVPEWALQDDKPTYTYVEVGALPEDTFIPSRVSELENDIGYINDVSDKASVVDFENYEAITNRSIAELQSGKVDAPAGSGRIGQVLTRIQDGTEWATLDASGSNYVLLNTTSLWSDTLTVSFDTDSNGNKLNLKSIVAIMSNENGLNGGSNAICYVYDQSGAVIGDTPVYFYAHPSAVKAAIDISLKGNVVIMNSTGWTSAVYSPVIKSIVSEANGTGNIAKIDLIGNGNTFRAGTAIKIYGVRA